LTKKSLFNENEDLVKEVNYTYQKVDLVNSNQEYIRGIWVAPLRFNAGEYWYVRRSAYRMPIYPYKVHEVSTSHYFEGVNSWQKTTEMAKFQYDSRYAFNTSKEIHNSDGSTKIKRFIYSGNLYTSANGTDEVKAIHALNNLNATKTLLETSNYVKKPTQAEKFLNARYSQYEISQNTPRIKSVWSTESLSTSVYYPISVIAGALNKSPLYTSQGQNLPAHSFLNYDDKGRVLMETRVFDRPTRYFWNDKYYLQIAQVSNANFKNSAYTDFDDNSNQVQEWMYSGQKSSNGFLGTSCALLNAVPITRSNLNPGTYTLQFRHKSGTVYLKKNGSLIRQFNPSSNDWDIQSIDFEIQSVNDILEITGTSALLDELALYASESQFQSYTYDLENFKLAAHLINNNEEKVYEYDDFHRLLGVKDIAGQYVTAYKYSLNQGIGQLYFDQIDILKEGVLNLQDVYNLNDIESSTSRTFLDGLGRPLQMVSIGSSPSKRDIIQHFEYDAQGKSFKSYLPFTRLSNGGAYRSNAAVFQNLSYGGFSAFAFNEVQFEESPINRIVQKGAPGLSWKIGSGHEVNLNYRSNIQNEVRLFNTNGVSLNTYPAEKLFVNETIDEDGKSESRYIDYFGRTIMVDKEGAQTYYVFDDFDRLKFVIPPNSIDSMVAKNNYNCNDPQLALGITKYDYNNRGLKIREKSPGSGLKKYYYDRIDRNVLTEDASGNKIFVKYDIHGRPIMRGEYYGNGIPSLNDSLFEINTTTGIFYSNYFAFPSVNFRVHHVDYYDDYDLDNNGSISSTESYRVDQTGEYINTLNSRNKGRKTGSKTLLLDGTSNYITKSLFLDIYGNPIQVRKNNALNGVDILFSDYNWKGQLKKSKRINRILLDGSSISSIISTRNEYDHRGRLIDVFQSINGNPEVHLAKHKISERELLVELRLGLTNNGTKYLQDIDYKYNIRNWLVEINDVNVNSSNGFQIGEQFVPNQNTTNQ
jgi:hypothetical protein